MYLRHPNRTVRLALLGIAVLGVMLGVKAITPASTDAVINGEPVAMSSFPWAALVESPEADGVRRCGGTIVGSRWVLTAAHCVSKDGVLRNPRRLMVSVGRVAPPRAGLGRKVG